ncbi:porin family protein [Sphingobacterium lactis]|uniref:Outer membrane protein beta-barrel domain-containing protein n=1 Tax=Sphingobacterium lactis TaxID=797291 RepID=A0A1H6CI76_9SPHI|nr:porin family protein [Sphingobacterium lactis]SEG72106.1 Outer membrane protein beta-barrel domain-containing protein [Sphingobacterium lactis]
MKKLLLSFGAAFLLAAGAQAQTSYGLKAGVNLGKFSNVTDAEKDYQTNNVSFYVTGFADLPVAPQFSIQPGVSLQGKGNKFNYDGDGLDGSVTTNVMSIEIPVNAVYYIPAGSGNVFLGAGPYVGFNVSGKTKGKGTLGNNTGEFENDLKFSGDNKNMNLIDAGANFMAGYKFNNGLLLNAGYGLGLTNLNPNDNGDKSSTRTLSFGLGFQF